MPLERSTIAFTDAGVEALVLAEASSISLTDLQSHPIDLGFEDSRGRGQLVDRGTAGLSAVYYSAGPNGRRPDLKRVDLERDGGMSHQLIATEPTLFTVQDVAAAKCAENVVVAFTDDLTGAGPCGGNYCDRPLVRVLTGFDGGQWQSTEADGGYVRSVSLVKNGDWLDVAWLSARSDGTAQLVVLPALICCGP